MDGWNKTKTPLMQVGWRVPTVQRQGQSSHPPQLPPTSLQTPQSLIPRSIPSGAGTTIRSRTPTRELASKTVRIPRCSFGPGGGTTPRSRSRTADHISGASTSNMVNRRGPPQFAFEFLIETENCPFTGRMDIPSAAAARLER